MSKTINRLIGQAMGHYNMLAEGDNVLIAVSGGVDSLVLAAILKSWQKKAPINYTISAVYLDMGFKLTDFFLVKEQLARLNIKFFTEELTISVPENQKENFCFTCAGQRRKRLFQLAKEKNFNKLAMGHHKDDIIETFIINLLYSGNISTMVPCQKLFNGSLSIIRPLAYLEKKQIIKLGRDLQLKSIAPCPMAGNSKRNTARELLNILYKKDKKIKSSIFAALANVRQKYLL